MAPLETVGQVADRAVELGIVAPAAVAMLADERDEPLSYCGDDNAGALIDLMEELGVGVRVVPRVGSLLEGYRDLFDRFAACSGGAVAITKFVAAPLRLAGIRPPGTPWSAPTRSFPRQPARPLWPISATHRAVPQGACRPGTRVDSTTG